MTFRDFISISAGNLTRMKLRTFLTVSGVVIAIGTFVAMVSFGAGNQIYMTEQFNKLGLFSTMQVYPQTKTSATDTAKARLLDNQAIDELVKIPGVRLVYPFDAFSVTVAFADSQMITKAQALPMSALQTKLFSQIESGRIIAGDSAREVMVTSRFLHLFKIPHPDSVLGKAIVLSVRVATIDSGLAKLFPRDPAYIREKMKTFRFDSLRNNEYRQRLARSLANEGISRFLDGFLNSRATVVDTMTIVGVFGENGPSHMRMEAILLPSATASRFKSSGLSDNPTELFSTLSSGSMFSFDTLASSRSYPQVTMDLDPNMPLKPISDSVKALGFRSFSFAEMFDEMKKFFFYFTLALSVVGLIALATASLGIVNTMVMSILERRREIGVLKSLGASETDIRLLFLVESGVIGAVGAVIGIFLGWVATRIASLVMKIIMEKQGIGEIELFAMPIWLILISLVVGIGVSVLAGYYPASRASAVDPVEALRND